MSAEDEPAIPPINFITMSSALTSIPIAVAFTPELYMVLEIEGDEEFDVWAKDISESLLND